MRKSLLESCSRPRLCPEKTSSAIFRIASSKFTEDFKELDDVFSPKESNRAPSLWSLAGAVKFRPGESDPGNLFFIIKLIKVLHEQSIVLFF